MEQKNCNLQFLVLCFFNGSSCFYYCWCIGYLKLQCLFFDESCLLLLVVFQLFLLGLWMVYSFVFCVYVIFVIFVFFLVGRVFYFFSSFFCRGVFNIDFLGVGILVFLLFWVFVLLFFVLVFWSCVFLESRYLFFYMFEI